MTNDPRPLPEPTPETLPYWEAAKRHELSIQQCRGCQHHYFYPRLHCPHCGSDDVEWTRVSGRATLWSYIINHLPTPGFSENGPYVVAAVKLEEGPVMMTSLVDLPALPEALPLDLPLEVRFDDRGDWVVPVFGPAPTNPQDSHQEARA